MSTAWLLSYYEIGGPSGTLFELAGRTRRGPAAYHYPVSSGLLKRTWHAPRRLPDDAVEEDGQDPSGHHHGEVKEVLDRQHTPEVVNADHRVEIVMRPPIDQVPSDCEVGQQRQRTRTASTLEERIAKDQEGDAGA